MLKKCLSTFPRGRITGMKMMIEYQRVQRVRVSLVDLMGVSKCRVRGSAKGCRDMPTIMSNHPKTRYNVCNGVRVKW